MAGCRVCVRSPGDRVKIERSSTVVRTRWKPSVWSAWAPSPYVSSLSRSTLLSSLSPPKRFANDDVSNTISAPSVARRRLPYRCSKGNRTEVAYHYPFMEPRRRPVPITVISFAVRATNRRRFERTARESRLRADVNRRTRTGGEGETDLE